MRHAPVMVTLAALSLGACGDPFVPEIPPPDPHIVRTAPSAGTVGIARAAVVSVTFSDPVREGTVHEGSLVLYDGSVAVRADVRVSEDRQSATLTPRDLLSFGTRYSVVLGGTVVTEDGRRFASRSWTFDTKRNPVH